MIPLKVILHNSGKQKIAKFSINTSEGTVLTSDPETTRAIRQICLATLEMAQNNMILDLCELSPPTQLFISGVLEQLLSEAIQKKQLFTDCTSPRILLNGCKPETE